MTKKSGLHDQKDRKDINNNIINKKGDARAPVCEKATPDAAARDALVRWAVELFGSESEELIAALLGFCDSRLERKKPIPGGRAITALTSKLMRYSNGIMAVMVEMLDKSVLHRWDSVYQLKDDELQDVVGRITAHEEDGGERWV